jgi:hypothetical protein
MQPTFIANHSNFSFNPKTTFLKMLIDDFLVYLSPLRPAYGIVHKLRT